MARYSKAYLGCGCILLERRPIESDEVFIQTTQIRLARVLPLIRY